jgi:hypothetical protein
MNESVLRKCLRELHADLRRVNDAIIVLERMASGRPRRGRQRKFESELVRKLLRPRKGNGQS